MSESFYSILAATGAAWRWENNLILDVESREEVDWQSVRERLGDLSSYQFDQYRNYPSSRNYGWTEHWIDSFEEKVGSSDWLLFWIDHGESRCLLGARISEWDYNHFGFPIAFLRVLFHSLGEASTALEKCLKSCFQALAARNVRFASARIHGDQLQAIHIFEQFGFKYFENIIWPVATGASVSADYTSCGVRQMTRADLTRVMGIAEQHQYQRGHFHCDVGFDRSKVDSMYAAWVSSAFESGKSVLVIEQDRKIAGYFVVELDEVLTRSLGSRYGRMQSLALDSNFRGVGLGRKLFMGAISWMKAFGAEFIDSGYASKNHLSAKLHSEAGFFSIYEEVTLHHWL